MKIPQSPVDLRDYHRAIVDALSDAEVPLYLDTSFLMWLLQAGDGVRGELLQWLTKLGGRVVVPTWTAHELYRHIRTEKVLHDLQGRLKQYTAGLGQALIELSVSADDNLCERTPFSNRSHLLQSLRSDFVKIQKQLSSVLDKKKIQAQYERALGEVITFVNQRVAKSDPFSSFTEISMNKDLRFSGRVPPGFKDEGKAGKESKEGKEGKEVKGDNSCGDLVFWQEVLADLEKRKGSTAIIVTNDNKSDWHYKPELLLNYDGERKSVIPHIGLEARLPHPLLEHEAFCKAGTERVVIVDVNILGVVLSKMDASAAKTLVAATHPPLIDREEEGVNWSVIDPKGSAQASTTAAAAGSVPAPVETPAEEKTTDDASAPQSLIPIRDLGTPAGDFGELLTRLEGEFTDRAAAFDSIFATPFLSQRTPDELLLLGRRMYRSAALKGSPADVRLGELLEAGRSLNASERNSLALGMFAELYFDEDGNLRPSPLDGPWQPLFDLQYAEEFKEAIEQIAEMLSPFSDSLLVMPSITPAMLTIDLQLVRPPEKGPKLVESVIVNGKELLGDAVAGSSSSLSVLIGDRPSTVGALIRAVSRRFVIPLRQLEPNKDEGQPLSWADETGLRLLRLDLGGVCDELSLSFQEEES
jgi:hypothetical protein